MYVFELKDVMFCVKNLKSPTRGFKLDDYLTFRRSGTRSSTAMKMSHKHSSNNSTKALLSKQITKAVELASSD